MALTKVTGQVIKNTTDVTVGVLTVTNTLAVGGTVSIGGTLTYEDVTNVDAVGLITARNGIVVGSGITLSKDGDGFFTGVTTATTFVGALTGTASGNTTISNNADNRVITGGSGNALNGESTLTYDGTNLDLGDDKKIRLGAGQDLQIYHDGSSSIIRNYNTSTPIYIQPADSETGIKLIANGAVELYYDNSKKLETSSSGVTLVDGLLLDNATNAGRDVQWQPANDRLAFLDNTKATFGNELDLQIYHDSANSFIDEAGTGGLYIRVAGTSNNGFYKYPSNEPLATFQPDGAVSLYYDNSKKLETTSTGAQIENQLTVYGDAGNAGRILIAEGGAYSEIRTTRNSDDNGDLRFYTEISGSRALRMKIDYSGHLTPASDNTYDLGTSSLRWRNLYTTDLQLSNKGKTNDVDGTWGDWTLQEGENDIFMINNRTGKKFTITMREVS